MVLDDEQDGLGSSASRAIKLMNQLRVIGIEGDLSIPRIAFAGKQSAGKSSLVEALTGVQLPRNHGTCTRCPIQVTTTYQANAEWQCHIYLRLEYDDETMTRRDKVEVEDLCTVKASERNTLAEEIHNAQDAILRHANGKKFSRNVVCVEITSSECQDLSLIDLPGLIEAADTSQDEGYIDLILSLVRDYIAQKNTIILQIMAADDDVENQKIRTLAREVDPTGNRSIGVLTKPDKIEVDTESTTIDILLGRKYELRYGYFVIRTPKQTELNNLVGDGVSPEEARKLARGIEQRFFATDHLGKLMNQYASSRCGSEKLEKELSIMLRGMIELQIPAMKAKLLDLLKQTEEECSKLGKSIEKGTAKENLIKLSQKLERLVSSHVNAASDKKKFWHQINDELHDVAHKIEQTAPLFVINGALISRELIVDGGDEVNNPTLSLTIDRQQLSESTMLESKEVCIGGAKWTLRFLPTGHGNAKVQVTCTKLPKGARSVKANCTFTPAKFDSVSEEYSFSHGGSCDGFSYCFADLRNHVFIEATIEVKMYVADMDCPDVITVDDVEKMIASAKGRVLPIPGRPEYDTSEMIITQAVKGWKNLSIKCVEKVHDLLHALVCGESGLIDEAITKRFARMNQLHVEVMEEMLRERCSVTSQRITECCEMEEHLYTTNDAFLQSMRNRFIALIKHKIKPDVKDCFLDTLEDIKGIVMKELAKMGITQESISIMQATHVCSERVIVTIANTLSYFHLKASSYADIMSGHILFHLLGHFASDLSNQLIQRIGIFSKSDDELHNLFYEGADLSKRREDINRARERQQEGLKLIKEYIN